MSQYQARYQERKQQIINLLQSAISFAKNYKYKEIEQRLRDAQKRLVEGKLLVVVCGEFKEGKSSLINALLNEANDDLFPVDADIATGIVSTIAYGEREKITVILGEPGKEQEQKKQIQRREIDDYANEQSNKGNRRQARMLVIESPNQKLKDGLVLVDTPGVGGLNTQHTGITYSFIPEADAILFVSDVKNPLSADELKFLKFIADRCPNVIPNIIFVVTKIDSKPDYETIVANNREKLAQVLQRPGHEIPIIPVSSHTYLDYLRHKEDEDLEDSNFQALEEELGKLLTQEKGYILLMRALGELGPVLSEMKIPLQAELSTCQQESKEEIDNLERQFQTEQQRLQTLQADNANWQKQLARGVEDIRVELFNQLQSSFIKVQGWASDYMKDSRLLETPAEIAKLVERDIDTLMSDIGRQTSRKADMLHSQIEASSGLDLNIPNLRSLDWEKSELSTESVQIKKSGWWEKTLTVTRSGMFNATAGGTLASILGGAIGAGIGLLFGGVGAGSGAVIGWQIGAAIGGVSGLKSGVEQGLSQVEERETVAAQKEIAPLINQFIKESQQLCQQSLDKAVRGLKRSMTDELSEQIEQLKQTCDRTLRSIKQARKLTEQQKQEKLKQLAIPLKQLDQLYRSVETLANAAISQKEAAVAKTDNILKRKAETHQESYVLEASLVEKTGNADYGENWADG